MSRPGIVCGAAQMLVMQPPCELSLLQHPAKQPRQQTRCRSVFAGMPMCGHGCGGREWGTGRAAWAAGSLISSKACSQSARLGF